MAIGGLFNGKGYDGLFNRRINPVFENRLFAADFHQGGFAALIVELFEALKAVATKAHYLTGFRYTVELLGEFEQSYFVAYDLLFVGHLTSFLALWGNFNEMSD